MSALLVLLLAAGNVPPAISLAAPGFKGVGVEPARAAFYTDHAVQQFGFQGVRVMSAEQIGQVIGLEREKKIMGCGEGSDECMSELANALGTDGLLLGQVAQVGSGFQLDLRAVAATNGQPLAAYSASAPNEEALLHQVDLAAASMARDLSAKLGRPLAVTTAAPTGSSKAWIPAVAGAALAALGGLSLGLAFGKDGQLRGGSFPSAAAATDAANQGKTLQAVGWLGLGAGAVGLAGAGAVYVFARPAAQTGVALRGGEAGLVWTGTFP